MAIRSTLRMTFKNQNGRNSSISLNDPKDDLEADDVKDVMDDVIDKNVFITTGGNLVTKVKAVITETSDTVLFEE